MRIIFQKDIEILIGEQWSSRRERSEKVERETYAIEWCKKKERKETDKVREGEEQIPTTSHYCVAPSSEKSRPAG